MPAMAPLAQRSPGCGQVLGARGSAIARSQFTHVASTQRDSDVIFDMIETINDEMKHDEGFVQLAQSLRYF